jgi:penicillin amidase
MTNVMVDAVDILMLRVDPRHPARYRMGDKEEQMQKEDVVIALPKGKSVTFPLYTTHRGPAITGVTEGVEAVATLRWWGTLPEGTIKDRTFGGVIACMKARNVAEVLEAGRGWSYVSQNLLAADDGGHIGWHATGAIPVRSGYSGRVPADGSAGADWSGFVPYDSLPHRIDPPEGWLATANYRPCDGETGRPLSYSQCGPYRYERIVSLLAKKASPGVEDFRRMQMDTHSGQADRLLPLLLSRPFVDEKAREAVGILGAWDHELTAESAAAAVFEVFLVQLEKQLLADLGSEDFFLYVNAKLYGMVDEILQRPQSPLWKLPGSIDPVVKMERALVETMEFCARRMGPNPRHWSWGRIHRYAAHHPGSTSRVLSMLLDPPAWPAPGDGNTINAAWSVPAAGSFEVTTIPSMRMIASLGDPDGLLMIGPLGQSGQPGHPHYDDMMRPWREGALAPIPLSRAGVEKVARDVLVLSPGGRGAAT